MADRGGPAPVARDGGLRAAGCSITNEFDCGSAVPLIRIAVLALTGILATFLAFVGSGPR